MADLIVVGAGPAGGAAAVAAAGQGRTVELIDAGTRIGGQYWRHRAGGPHRDADLHHDLAGYDRLAAALAAAVAAGRVRMHLRHEVWTLEAGVDASGAEHFSAHAVDRSGAEPVGRTLRAAAVVLATGAHDRTVPFPGWDLPGVVTAGGAQALLKGQGVAVADRVLVAGTGPFLLPVAAGLVRRGVRVLGVHDANAVHGWLPHLAAVAGVAGKMTEGAGYLATLLRHRVPLVQRSTVVAAHGTDRVRAVTVARLDATGRVRPGTEQRVATDALAVGFGFSPLVELAVGLGCEIAADVDGSPVVAADEQQRSSRPGLWVAGEVTGVGGAPLAVTEGLLAGLSAAAAVTGHRPAAAVARLERRRDRLRRFAAALHSVYPEPAGWPEQLTADTVICRCEEVTRAGVDAAVASGATDFRSAKLLSRTGMGWCQGRICARSVATLVTRATGLPATDPGLTVRRPFAQPVPLGVLATEPD